MKAEVKLDFIKRAFEKKRRLQDEVSSFTDKINTIQNEVNEIDEDVESGVDALKMDVKTVRDKFMQKRGKLSKIDGVKTQKTKTTSEKNKLVKNIEDFVLETGEYDNKEGQLQFDDILD